MKSPVQVAEPTKCAERERDPRLPMVIDDAVESSAVPVVRGRVGGEGEGVGAEVQGEVGEAGAVEPFRNRSNDPRSAAADHPHPH